MRFPNHSSTLPTRQLAFSNFSIFLNISLLLIRFLTIPGTDDSVTVLNTHFFFLPTSSCSTYYVEWLYFRVFLTEPFFLSLLEIF
jgi:hypothetical protein